MKWTVENKVKAGAAGGIETVINAINAHTDNTSVCENGCWALSNMAVNGRNTGKRITKIE